MSDGYRLSITCPCMSAPRQYLLGEREDVPFSIEIVEIEALFRITAPGMFS